MSARDAELFDLLSGPMRAQAASVTTGVQLTTAELLACMDALRIAGQQQMGKSWANGAVTTALRKVIDATVFEVTA